MFESMNRKNSSLAGFPILSSIIPITRPVTPSGRMITNPVMNAVRIDRIIAVSLVKLITY